MQLTKANRLLILGLALIAAFAMFIAVSPAEAASTERISGNFVDTAVDTNGDGSAANYFSGGVRGSGNPTYEGIVEVAFSAPTGACDESAFEGTVVAYSIVRRYKSGDLKYSAAAAEDPGVLCFDPATGLATLVINAVYTGGTGSHANASGSYTASYDIVQLLPDAGGGIAHGSFTGTASS